MELPLPDIFCVIVLIRLFVPRLIELHTLGVLRDWELKGGIHKSLNSLFASYSYDLEDSAIYE